MLSEKSASRLRLMEDEVSSSFGCGEIVLSVVGVEDADASVMFVSETVSSGVLFRGDVGLVSNVCGVLCMTC